MAKRVQIYSFVKVCLFIALLIGAGTSFADTASRQGALSSYRIGPGDVLEFNVWKEEELTKEIIVPPDGVTSFPHAGIIRVEGRTVDQVQKEITKRLSNIIVDPIVTVFIKSYASHKIFVLGKVNTPGEFTAMGPVDVIQALAMAGGMAPFADQDSIKILRRVRGKLTAIPFDYADVAKGKNLDQNIMLNRGDVVVVP